MDSDRCKNKKDKEEGRLNEAIMDGSEMYSIDSCLFEVCHSICKILYRTDKGINKGTGFLIKFYKEDEPLFSLMTNEHVITKEVIDRKVEIQVYYHNEKKRIKIILNENERFIKNFKDMGIDCTIIEILTKDGVEEDYFLLPNIDYYDKNYNDIKNKKIYIVQFPFGKNMTYSKGKIININNYEFTHNASTEFGSSGSPVFLEQSTKVIGIHKQTDINKSNNFGDFIFPVVNELEFTGDSKKDILINNNHEDNDSNYNNLEINDENKCKNIIEQKNEQMEKNEKKKDIKVENEIIEEEQKSEPKEEFEKNKSKIETEEEHKIEIDIKEKENNELQTKEREEKEIYAGIKLRSKKKKNYNDNKNCNIFDIPEMTELELTHLSAKKIIEENENGFEDKDELKKGKCGCSIF